LAVCVVDIDDFKRVNDRFGHPAGDSVLSRVAARLRQTGESFRVGGDEFAVLLPGYGPDEALAAAKSIVERIGALRFGHMGSITVSAGVAHAHERGELLKLVDHALYAAKESGKNQARLYLPQDLGVALPVELEPSVVEATEPELEHAAAV
jgi:diguanylate cyclase (GGDEF)-like protein